jgi:uncharacterized protein YjiS (DUF1127 family)
MQIHQLVRNFSADYVRHRRDHPRIDFEQKEPEMVYYTNANGGVLATAIANVLSGAINTVFDTVVSWKDRRATRIALSRLSDRELEDIGLTRSQIDFVARR